MKTEKRERKICPHCDGFGFRIVENNSETLIGRCGVCDGTGMFIFTTISEKRPFNPEEKHKAITNNLENVKIHICDSCEGKGTTHERTSAYDSEDVKCVRCEGSGRIIEYLTYESQRIQKNK